MKIVEIKVLRGPNYWSVKRHYLIQMLLDLEELEYKPTNQIEGFHERIQKLLPSMVSHRCSKGKKGGFFMRVEEGTWMGHVIEHIALELQSLAGMNTGFGQTRSTGRQGQYHVVFDYFEEKEGLYAAHAAVRIAEALINNVEYDVQKDIDEIKRLWYSEKAGASTEAILKECAGRDIPFIQLDDSFYQLGYGKFQKRIQATLSENTSGLAVDIACNKQDTKKLLERAYVPVPKGKLVSSPEELRNALSEIDYPIVIKPLDGNHGKGATINIKNWNETLKAFNTAKYYSEKVIVEEYIDGSDFRILLVDHKYIAAAHRKPAHIKGDGILTIAELIELENQNPLRGNDHENILTYITVDEQVTKILEEKKYQLSTILPVHEELMLKYTANLSTGASATDVTESVHPDNIKLFERISRTIGLDICGIDVVAKDLRTAISNNGGVVVEVNAAPGLRMHLHPSAGKKRAVAKPIVDMLFPDNNCRIPIIAVTGTNGKTTTTRLIAGIMKSSGLKTGYTTTDGIYIDNELITEGDCSGPSSARFVLGDNSVECAVLETARGGILRQGLAFDKCDCAVITNIAEDHLGLDGIYNLKKLARVKSVIAEVVSEEGYAILNADDDLVYQIKERLDCNIALFSLDPNNDRIEEHCNAGGIAAIYDEGYIIIRKGNQLIPIQEVANIPVTDNGRCKFNIANVLAATLASYTMDVPLTIIDQALKSFEPSNENTPGRINLVEFPGFKVMLDYAHNPHGLKALGEYLNSFNVISKTGIITGVGDRRDRDIVAIAQEAAHIFDNIIIRLDKDLRGRTSDEIYNLLYKGIHSVRQDATIIFLPDEETAIEYAIQEAIPQSMVVVLTEDVKQSYQKIISCRENYSPNHISLKLIQKAG